MTVNTDSANSKTHALMGFFVLHWGEGHNQPEHDVGHNRGRIHGATHLFETIGSVLQSVHRFLILGQSWSSVLGYVSH